MESMLIGVFCILDLLLFYIFFESVLIPMFLIIGIWGSRERKIRASFLFFLYTLFGSVSMLLSILYIYYQSGTTDYKVLLTFYFSFFEQKFLWLSFFLSFATKVPMLPAHLWLPEAHVEAPTSGSVVAMYPVVNNCKRNWIIWFTLQPLDKGLFGPKKEDLKKKARERMTLHPGESISKLRECPKINKRTVNKEIHHFLLVVSVLSIDTQFLNFFCLFIS